MLSWWVGGCLRGRRASGAGCFTGDFLAEVWGLTRGGNSGDEQGVLGGVGAAGHLGLGWERGDGVGG